MQGLGLAEHPIRQTEALGRGRVLEHQSTRAIGAVVASAAVETSPREGASRTVVATRTLLASSRASFCRGEGDRRTERAV